MLRKLINLTHEINYMHRATGKNKYRIIKEVFKLDDKEECWNFYNAIKNTMVGIKVKDFLNVYPIKKTYKGKKYQEKDYYSSKIYVDTLLSITDEFTDDNITEFLMEVQLSEMFFEEVAVSMMIGVGYMYQKEKGLSMWDMFFEYGARSKNKEKSYLKIVK